MCAGDRTTLMWTLVMPEDRKGVEVLGIVSEVKREGGASHGHRTQTPYTDIIITQARAST